MKRDMEQKKERDRINVAKWKEVPKAISLGSSTMTYKERIDILNKLRDNQDLGYDTEDNEKGYIKYLKSLKNEYGIV